MIAFARNFEVIVHIPAWFLDLNEMVLVSLSMVIINFDETFIIFE